MQCVQRKTNGWRLWWYVMVRCDCSGTVHSSEDLKMETDFWDNINQSYSLPYSMLFVVCCACYCVAPIVSHFAHLFLFLSSSCLAYHLSFASSVLRCCIFRIVLPCLAHAFFVCMTSSSLPFACLSIRCPPLCIHHLRSHWHFIALLCFPHNAPLLKKYTSKC